MRVRALGPCLVLILLAGCSQAPASLPEASPGSDLSSPTQAPPQQGETAGTTQGPPSATPAPGPTSAQPSPPSAQKGAAANAPGDVGPAGADLSAAPWWLLEVEANTSGSAAGFLWTVPKGAYHRHADVEQWQQFTVEACLIEGRGVESYTLSVLRLRDGKWTLTSSYLALPLEVTAKTTPALVTTRDEPAPTQPFRFSFFKASDQYNVPAEGEVLGFLLTATGSPGAKAGVAMRVLDGYPQGSLPDAGTFTSALRAKGTGAAIIARGIAQGVMAEGYVDINYGFAGPVGLFGLEAVTKGLRRSEGLPTYALEPVAGLRQASFDAGAPLTKGWSVAQGLYYTSSGTAEFTYDVSAFSQKGSATRHAVGNPGLNLVGLVGYVVTGDGNGATATHADITLADTNSLQLTSLIQLAVGASLQDLLGAPAATGSIDVALLPVVAHEPGAVALQAAAFAMTLPHP